MNLKVALIILILAIIVIAIFIFSGAEPAWKNDNNETSLNDSITDTTPVHIPASNTTNKTQTGPGSIPLEKPPFID